MRLPTVLFCAALGFAASASAQPNRPNVIFFLSDDLGYGDVGVFGQTQIQTPNMDKLAREGMRFTQSYAGETVCAPSRCSLMTGLDNGHSWIRGNRETPPEGQVPMPAGTFTVAQLMKNAGYATGCVGKWGLGFPGSTSTPDKMGFDFFYGYNCQMAAHDYYPDHLWRNNDKVILDKKTYSDDLIEEEGLRYIRENKDHPFFLYFASTLPHLDLQVPSLGVYADKPWTAKQKTIAAMITRLDTDLGRVMAELKELGIDDRTLVIFASDNGATYRDPAFHHSGDLRGFKRDMYEGGLRSPSIARWPGHVPAGVVSDQVWTFWDFLPTMAELTGEKPPAGLPLDGISVLSAWLGGKTIAHPPLYFEFHERGFSQAARIGDWKAVRKGTKKPIELYDLTTDLSEAHDVAAQHPDIVAQFDAYLKSARVDSALWPITENVPPGKKKAGASAD